ncbi:hypothetical protein GS506_14455 [Rhodococcus hoagii]|nr:hypothetical protein [Prescottella equi]
MTESVTAPELFCTTSGLPGDFRIAHLPGARLADGSDPIRSAALRRGGFSRHARRSHRARRPELSG